MGLMSRVPSGYDGRYRMPYADMGADPRADMSMTGGMMQGGMMQPSDPPPMQNPLMPAPSPTTAPAAPFTPTQMFSMPMPQNMQGFGSMMQLMQAGQRPQMPTPPPPPHLNPRRFMRGG